MVGGGPYTVRAFDMSALSGDLGTQETAEWRHDLPVWQGQWQEVAFLDSEHLRINKSVWTAGPNAATLSGAGAGLNWSGPRQWSAKASIASRLGSTPVLLGATSRVRAWIQIAKGF
jgi:hemolysin activation/secretion protein